MAVFGEHNYATPFGALQPSEFFNSEGSGYYDFSGFSNRSGWSGFSGTTGWSGFSSFCGPNGIEFIPWKPTLTFPLNYAVLDGIVRVTWKEAIPQDPCGDLVYYELQFTRTFSLDSGWKTIAVDILQGTNYYDFDVTTIPYTDDGGLRLRAYDTRTIYSDYSQSSEAFIIANHAPNQPTLIAPIANDTFDYCLPVVWKEATVKEIDGQAITYKIRITDTFSSDSGWTDVPGAETLADGTTSYNVSCFDFPDGNNYGIELTAVDSLGLGSIPIRVGPLFIKHQGSFIIDTIAPEGSISINDGAVVSATSQVKLTLSAFDATTGIKDVRFKNDGEDCWSDFDTFTTEKFWDLPKSDGVKRVFVQYRDYAGNLSSVCDCEVVSRVLCGAGNVTDIEVFNGKLYVAFDEFGNLVEYRVLINTAATFPESEISALARFGNNLFVATYDGTDSVVYSFYSSAIRKFNLAGMKILTMLSYNDILYLGLSNGMIKSYDGSSLSTVYVTSSAVDRLRTNGAMLYATVRGGGEFLSTANGISWQVNSF